MALRRQGLLDGPNDERMRQRTGIQARLTGIFHIFFSITEREARRMGSEMYYGSMDGDIDSAGSEMYKQVLWMGI